MMQQLIPYMITGAVLSADSFRDLKEKRIYLWISLIWGLSGAILWVLEGKATGEYLLPMLLSATVVFAGLLTGGQVGLGDGFVLMASVFWLSPEEFETAFLFAFAASGFTSLLLLTIGRRNAHYKIPFVPFWAIAVVVAVGLCHIGGMR